MNTQRRFWVASCLSCARGLGDWGIVLDSDRPPQPTTPECRWCRGMLTIREVPDPKLDRLMKKWTYDRRYGDDD